MINHIIAFPILLLFLSNATTSTYAAAINPLPPSPTTTTATPATVTPTPVSTVYDSLGHKFTLQLGFSCIIDFNYTVLRGPSNGWKYRANRTAYGCGEECGTSNYPFFGLIDGSCVCGKEQFETGGSYNDTRCNIPCSDDPSTTCGGPGLMTLYSSSDPFVQPLHVQQYGYTNEWVHKGCFAGDSNTLPPDDGIANIPSSSLTVSACTEQCQDKGTTIAWLYRGNECRCGAKMPSRQLDPGDCDSGCPNGDECGGRMDQYDVYERCSNGQTR